MRANQSVVINFEAPPLRVTPLRTEKYESRVLTADHTDQKRCEKFGAGAIRVIRVIRGKKKQIN